MDAKPMTLEEKLDKHVMRWRDLASNPATVASNVQMGEDAVNEICRRYKGKPPSAVVWCDSPYEFAVIPAVVVNFLDGAGVNYELDEVFKDIASHPRLRRPSPEVFARFEQRITTLIEALKQHKPIGGWQFFDEKARREKNGPYSVPPSDFDCVKGACRLELRIREWLDLSPWDLHVFSWLGPVMGVIDRRIVTKALPVAELLLGATVRGNLSARQKEEIKLAKERCTPINTTYMGAMNFWMQLAYVPSQDMRMDVERDGELGTAFGAIAQAVTRQFQAQDLESRRPNVATSFSLWLPHYLPWVPFAMACRFIEPDPLTYMAEEIDDWGYLSRAALACLFTKDVAFLLKRPTSVTLNDSGQVHNDSGPATVWQDGFETYAWKGVTVDRRIIMEPETIEHTEITAEFNLELRRVLIERYGEARYLKDSGAKLVHEDECGILYRAELPGDEPLVMVKVKNSTPEPDGTFKYYYLRVPPHMVRAKQAVAWTFGLEENEYHPGLQT